MRTVIQKKRTARGFTKSKREIVLEIKKLKKAFENQNHYQDPVKFIADKLDEIGFIDQSSKVSKYTSVNKFIVVNDEDFHSLRDSYDRYHRTPNPNFSYDNGGPRDLEELLVL